MADPISSIRNLGPAVEAAFAQVGITTAQQVRDLGADEAYRRLLQGGKTRPHFIGYYVMVMGLQGRPWNDCQGQEKIDLRKRFDEIKASVKPKDFDNEIERILDQIGVRAKK